MSIKVKLIIAFLFFTLTPLLIFSTIMFVHYRLALQAQYLLRLEVIAAFQANKIDTFFSGLKTNIYTVQRFYGLKKDISVLIQHVKKRPDSEYYAVKLRIDEQLQKIQKVVGLDNIIVAGLDERVVYSSNPNTYDYKSETFIEQYRKEPFLKGKEGFFISKVLFDVADSRTPRIIVSAPFLGLTGDVAGVIMFDIDMLYINELVDNYKGLGSTGEILIMEKSGDKVVFLNSPRHNPDRETKWQVAHGSKLGLASQKAVDGKTGSGLSMDYSEDKVLAAWRFLPSLDWGLVAKIDVDDAFADLIKLKYLMLLLLLSLVGASGLVAVVIASSITKPLKRLNKGAEIVGQGGLDHEVALPLNDEIGQLSRSFDKMTRNLKEITTSRDELNQEIGERIQAEWDKETTVEILRIINESHSPKELLSQAAAFLQLRTSCDAIAFRYQSGNNYPYYETRGLAQDYINVAGLLCICDDKSGESCERMDHSFLGCLYTKVVNGRFDQNDPCFTSHGTFWTNNAIELSAANPYNNHTDFPSAKVNLEGYESLAIFPLVDGSKRFGLLELYYLRKNALSIRSIVLWEQLTGYLSVALSKFKAEEELVWIKERNSILSDAATVLLVAADQHKAIDAVCQEVMSFIRCDVFLNFLDVVGNHHFELSAYSGLTKEDAARLGVFAREVNGDILILKDRQYDFLRGCGVRAFCCYFLQSDDVRLGTLSFGAKDRDKFNENELSLMKIITDMVSVAIQRKRTDELERCAKEEWERTFNSVPDLIAILDDQHKLLRVNQAMAQRLQRRPEDCIGLPCYTLFHDSNVKPDFCPHAQTITDGQQHSAEFYSSSLKGDFLVTTTPLLDSKGRMSGTVHVARDISEHKKREETLQRLNRSLLALKDSGFIMIRATSEPEYLNEVCRMVTQDCGYFKVWIGFVENDINKTVRPVASSGFSDDDIRTMNIPWADNESGAGASGMAIRSVQPVFSVHTRADLAREPWMAEELKQGAISSFALPLISAGKPFGVIKVYSQHAEPLSEDEVMLLTDLASDLSYGIEAIRLRTAKLEVDVRIRQSEERYRRLVEMSPEAVLVCRHEIVTYVNPAMIKLLGADFADELIGVAIVSLFHKDCSGRISELGILSNGKRSSQLDSKIIKRDGTERLVEVFSSTFVDYDGMAIQILMHDITERKKVEDILMRDKETFKKLVNERTAELLAVQVELERSRRLSDIGTLAATVAHELRNPLAAINMATENIKRKAKNPDLEKHLQNISHKVAESDQIINNLLFYSRLKSPQYESINIGLIIEDCLDILKHYAKKQVSINTSLSPIHNLVVDADPLQMKELFINIFNNSWDALPDIGGVIKVRCEAAETLVKIIISDNGLGMTQSDLERAFDPFFTTKSKGTGLGLSVCQQMITFHGGSIVMKSELNKGTEVEVTLPKKNRPQDGFLLS